MWCIFTNYPHQYNIALLEVAATSPITNILADSPTQAHGLAAQGAELTTNDATFYYLITAIAVIVIGLAVPILLETSPPI